MKDNVQLREEEIVGDEVVLSDIYPKTNTSSIVDNASGTNLSEALDRIQEKINNKLSRVVNSVNGRTGVIVLDSEDVGLGNVDNVSFSDIKGWVINLLVSEFANKRVALLNSLDEADSIASLNQEQNRDRPFYAENGYTALNDKKSYIGYFRYDEALQQLVVVPVPIYTIGSTDESLLYNTDIGRLSVRIKSGENALRVSRGEDPGLYIDKISVMPTIRYFDGVWGRIDEYYVADEERGSSQPPTVEDNTTEYKYRVAMKGFCPTIDSNVTDVLSANRCQYIIMRFHSDRYSTNTEYLGNTLGSGYYVGDKTFNEGKGINHATSFDGYTLDKIANYDWTDILNGQDIKNTGIYKRQSYEVKDDKRENSITTVEYVLLRTAPDTLKPGEVIYCAFRPPVRIKDGKTYIYDETTGERLLPPYVNEDTVIFLTNRTPAFGIVSRYKDQYQEYDSSRIVVLDFYEQEIQPGWSLEYSIPGKLDCANKALEVEVSRAKVRTRFEKSDSDKWDNFSGLQTISPQNSEVDDLFAGNEDKYQIVSSKPDDWDNNWMDYYEKLPDGTYTKLETDEKYDWIIEQYNRTIKFINWVHDHEPSPEMIAAIIKYITLGINPGDFNLDGKINAQDVADILSYAAAIGNGTQNEWTFRGTGEHVGRQNILNGDFNTDDGEGVINANDAVKLAKFLHENGDQESAEHSFPQYVTDNWESFAELVPYESFKDEPRYVDKAYVWGHRDIEDIDPVDEAYRDKNSWKNAVQMLLMYTIYFMYDEEINAGYPPYNVTRIAAYDFSDEFIAKNKGDFNLDGVIDQYDVVDIRSYAAAIGNGTQNEWKIPRGPHKGELVTDASLVQGDLTGDHTVTSADAAMLQTILDEAGKSYYDEAIEPLKFEENKYYRLIAQLTERQRYVMLPSGPTLVYDTAGTRTGGIFVNPDASMCVIPHKLCFNDTGHSQPNREELTEILSNWRPTLPKTRYSSKEGNIKNRDITDVVTGESNFNTSAVKDSDCYIGINLMKGLTWLPGEDSYARLETEPSDWKTMNWTKNTKYYQKSTSYDEYVLAEGVKPTPTSVELVYPEFNNGTYYVRKDGRSSPDHLTYDKYYSYNASGLRVLGNYSDFDQTKVDYTWFGMNYGEYETRYGLNLEREQTLNMNIDKGVIHSGGLSVNVGKFLEIDPGRYKSNYVDWYDGGKVNVRIGKGLQEEPVTRDSSGRQLTGNRIQLAIDSDSGFKFDSDGKLAMKPIISSISRLNFVDSYNTTFVYDPLPSYLLTNNITYNDIVFQLGKGLKLVTDETRARDFDTLLDSLSVIQLEIFLDCTDETIASIMAKIDKRKLYCKKNDYALEADTEAINKVILYHPAKGQGLPYYTMSLRAMIAWAVQNNVEGVSVDDRGPTTSENYIPISVNKMTLRELKDRVAYRWVMEDGAQQMPRIGFYKDETYKLIAPYTEVNTAPIATMLTYYGWTDLNETIYNSLMYKWHKKKLEIDELLKDATYDADKFGNPDFVITYGKDEYGNDIEYKDPITYIMAVCKDIRTALSLANINQKSFEEELTDDENLHIKVDSCGELWTGIVEHLGYTTAQEWLDDKNLGLTPTIIRDSINALAVCAGTGELDYGWSEHAAVFRDRLSTDGVQTVVTIRNVDDTITHKVSLAYLRKIEKVSVDATDVNTATYDVLNDQAPTDWSTNWKNYYVKFVPLDRSEPYEASKYFRADVKTYILMTQQPSNWTESYFKYYMKDSSGKYKHIARGSAPTWQESKYYQAGTVEFVQLTSADFNDTTFVGTNDDYTFYPPTDDKWDPRTEDNTSTLTSTTGKIVSLTGELYSSFLTYVAENYKGSATSLNETDLKNAGLMTFSEWSAYQSSLQSQTDREGTKRNVPWGYSSSSNTSQTGLLKYTGTSSTTYGTIIDDSKIVAYTPVQEVHITLADGTEAVITAGGNAIYGTSTTSGGSNATNTSTNTSTAEYWYNVWMQYWVRPSKQYITLEEAGYSKAPLFVKGMFYKKATNTDIKASFVPDEILDIRELRPDGYTAVQSGDGSPAIWRNSDKYYVRSEQDEYSEIYEEPADWKTMDWANNTKYYNWQKSLLTSNPGAFIPKNYYTKATKVIYTLLNAKPSDWDTPTTDGHYGCEKYYTRTDGTQVKLRDDVNNATWLETGNRVIENDKFVTWYVTDKDTNAHAGLNGFQGEDLNMLMLYVLGRRLSIKQMLSMTTSTSPWISWTADIPDEENSSSDSDSSSSSTT